MDNLLKIHKPKLYNKLPRFVIGWLSKIICQDKINRLLTLYGHHEGVEFIDDVFKDFNVEIICHGLDNVPPTGKKLFVANHPLGAIDGLAVISTVNKVFGTAKGIVNDLLLHIHSLKSVFCGVNVYGHNTPEVSRNIDTLYGSNDNVCVFPAGMCSRRIDGKIQDLPWKKAFIEKALHNCLPIVPIYVEAENSNFFYSVANIRKKLGIKFNYELVLLPSEFFKYHDKPIHIYYGEPIPPERLAEIKTPAERAQYVREATYKLAASSATTNMK